MIRLEYVRLALLGLFILLLQLAWYLAFPNWRGGFDVYLVFLLLVSSARGPLFGGTYALAGGLIMDAISGPLPVFHLLYYFIPVLIGAQLRSHMLLKFRFLGSGMLALLLLGKIAAQLAIGVIAGWLPSAWYIFQVNYLSLLLCVAVVYALWPWLISQIPPGEDRKRVVY
jgi:hypothetical protein